MFNFYGNNIKIFEQRKRPIKVFLVEKYIHYSAL